jgi:hypothetical protein
LSVDSSALGRPADDEGRARLVDEDRVHLVHDREIVSPLDVAGQLELHVVAQVVEAELVVRAVRDVGGVGDLALGVVEVVLDDADGEAQEAEDPAHPLAVALGQVVVDGDDVDALAGQGVQVRGQGGDEGLALARLHLRDHPAVQGQAADELHVEVPHVEDAAAGLAHHRERFGEDVVERLALGQPVPEFERFRLQLGVAEGEDRRLEGDDALDQGSYGLELPLVLRTDYLGEYGVDHS